MFFYLPENLNIEQILKENPPNFKHKVEYFKFLLSLINSIPAKNKHLDLIDGYTQISSKILKGQIPMYALYYRYLEKIGVIYINHHYYESEKCKGYKFADVYQTPLMMENVASKPVRKYTKNESAFNRNMKRKHIYLIRPLEDGKLNINADAALDYAHLMYERKMADRNTWDRNSKGHVINPKDQLEWAKISINNISHGLMYPVFDDKGFRLHSTLTSLKSELRNFLTYNGQKLVSLDIKNSQLYFSPVIFNRDFLNKHSDCFNIYDILGSKTRKYLLKLLPALEALMWESTPESFDRQEFQRYKKIVETGFYEYMQIKLTEALGGKYNTREKAKETMFQVLFSKNETFRQSFAAPKRLFAELFPEVYRIFEVIKSGQYNQLALLLQNIESRIILGIVAKRIARERQWLNIFTIHDSLATTVGHEDYVESIMREELLRLIHLQPTIKREYWSPKALDNIAN